MTKERQSPQVVDVVRDSTGAALVEFTFLLPALLLLVFGIIQLGLVAHDYIMVTNAATVGARTFAYSRNDANAQSDTVAAINAASSFTAAQLANVTVTLSVNGTVCTGNSGCANALEAAWASGFTPPQPVTVTVSYACAGAISIMPTYLISLTGFCPMTSAMAQPVQ